MAKLEDVVNCAKLTCEWANCSLNFSQRVDFLTHIYRTHVAAFSGEQRCKWQGCEELPFTDMELFQLHMSLHGHHHQLMHEGYKLMKSKSPKLHCFNDPDSRNLLPECDTLLRCGWHKCGGEFSQLELYIEHVDAHALEDVDIPVMSREKLKREKFAKCQWLKCTDSFTTKSHLKIHLASHIQKKTIACPICGITFCNKIGLVNHCYRQNSQHFSLPNFESDTLDDDSCHNVLTIDEQAGPSSFVILADGKRFSVANAAYVATSQRPITQLTAQANSTTPGECNNNSQSILRLPTQNLALLVNVNLAQASSGNRSNLGEITDQSEANNVIQLSLASATMVDDRVVVEEKEFSCPHCPKSFSSQVLLSEHIAKHTRNHSCPHCEYKAPFPVRLREHILYRHSEERPFECKFCEQRFKTKYSLKRHVILHNTEKQHQCTLCKAKFNSTYVLNRHFRVTHLQEQVIFACHLCDRSYSRGCNLSRHLTKGHKLRPSKGWQRFVYGMQADGRYRLIMDNGAVVVEKS